MDDLVQRLRDSKAMGKLVGEAPSFATAVRQLPEIARSDAAVLIVGETGTGKELVARALHYLSHRAPFSFIPVNCGSLLDSLMESELFGHERGAFTNAHESRPGLVAQAEKGTLFLDEVDSLTAKAQVALLRVLQDKKYRSVGSKCEKEADVRIVAASNAPLEDRLSEEAFRADLYYRLCVFRVSLPPLRDRKEDIDRLAQHFLKKHAPEGNSPPKLNPSARAALLAFDWPGNVRELENAIVRAIHLSPSRTIGPESLGIPRGAESREGAPRTAADRFQTFGAMKRRVIEEFEVNYLIRLMQRFGGNVSQAARAAGKERRDLGKMLKKYGLDPKSFKHGPADVNALSAR